MSQGQRKTKAIVSTFVFILAIGTVVWFSLTGYGKVSDDAYEIATATYSACLSRNDERISAVADLLNAETTSSTMTDREINWLRDILKNARDGKWESAASSARRMMEDQVEY